VHLDAEDSLALATTRTAPAPRGAKMAVVKLPHLSNSTDFRLLSWADWIDAPVNDEYDLIVLPGTKNTLADLAWLHDTGLVTWILDRHRRGARVVGICGGYQMLGRVIRDPDGMESSRGAIRGLGLLPAETVLATQKVTRAVRATTMAGCEFSAYEIHLGETRLDVDGSWRPFARLTDGTVDGAVSDGVLGTYLHGALEDPGVCAEVFGVSIGPTVSKSVYYDQLADWFDEHARHVDGLLPKTS
jgi:adenosylcobyric acid synthase